MGRQTSTDAFHERERTGTEKGDRGLVREKLRDHPFGLAGFEVDNILDDQPGRGHYHKRLSELESRGLAHRKGTRKNPATGRKGDVWFAGPAPEMTRQEKRARSEELFDEAYKLRQRAADIDKQAMRLQKESEPQRELFG